MVAGKKRASQRKFESLEFRLAMTTTTASLVADLRTDPYDSFPATVGWEEVDGYTYFLQPQHHPARNLITPQGTEIWRTDGQEFELVESIAAGSPTLVTSLGDDLFFESRRTQDRGTAGGPHGCPDGSH